MADGAQSPAAKLKVFISYSRRNQAFVDNLAPALTACGFETVYDREDIAPGEDWQERLDRLIIAADTVVYVISPDSVKSERVGWEVEQTERRGKRILPLLIEPVEEARVPAGLTRLNWIGFDKPEKFGAGLGQLVAALNTDLDWVRDHTRLGEIAARWTERGKPEALLIRGEELHDAERWLAVRPPGGLQATELHKSFISASRTSDDARLTKERAQLEAISVAQSEREKALADAEVAQRARTRQQKRLTYGLVAVAAIVVLGGAMTIMQSRDVAKNRAELMGYLAQQSISDAAYERSMRLSLQGLKQYNQPLLGFQPDDAGVKTLEATLANGTMLSRLRFALPSGNDVVTTGAFTPDGKAVLAASDKGTIWVLQSDSGKVIGTFKSEGGNISKLVPSDDSTLVAVRSFDGSLSVRALPAGNQVMAVPSQEARVFDVAISPDNRLVAAVLADGTARVWSLETKRELSRLSGHAAEVLSVRFDPAGRSILTTSADGTARVWNARSFQLIARLEHEKGQGPGQPPLPIAAARYVAKGSRLLTVSASSAKVWDAATGAKVAERAVQQSEWPDFDLGPDGQVLNHSGSSAVMLEVLGRDPNGQGYSDAESAQPLITLKVAEPVLEAAFSKDASRALVTTDKAAYVWDVASQQILTRIALGPDDQVLMSPDGVNVFISSQQGESRVLQVAVNRSFQGIFGSRRSAAFRTGSDEVVIAGYGGTLVVANSKTGELVRSVVAHEQGRPLAIAIDPSGRKLVTAGDDGAVSIWEIATWRPIALEGHRKAVKWATFDPAGGLLVTCSEDATARVWDATSGKLLLTLQHDKYVSSASFSPDSKRLVTGSWDNTARIWDTSNGAKLQELKGHTQPIDMVEFSPDGTRVVTASLDKTARVWNAASGREAFPPLEHLGGVVSAAYSRDGKRLVTASFDKTAHVWDAATGASTRQFRGHTEPVNMAAFSPDGERVVTASQDKTARLWDVRYGAQIATVAEHTAAVQSATFSPDGKRVVTTSQDGSGRLWEAEWPLELQGNPLRTKVCTDKLIGAQTITRTDAEIYPSLKEYRGQNVCENASLISQWKTFGRLLWPGWLFGAGAKSGE